MKLTLLAMDLALAATVLSAKTARIEVHADRVLKQVSRHLTGACIEDVNHEIYGGLYSQMIFGESFQEPAPAPPIPGFLSYGEPWTVRGGAVRIDGGNGSKLVRSGYPFQDGAVSVEVWFDDPASGHAGLIVRVNRPDMGPDRFGGYEASLDPARQMLRFARNRRNPDPIQEVHCEVPLKQWIPLAAKLKGSEIEILVNGKSLLHYTDSTGILPAGEVGLRALRREAAFRNFQVQTGDRPETLALQQESPWPGVSGMWRAIGSGAAQGHYELVAGKLFAGRQSQRIVFDSGQGAWGVENQGLNRWGMSFVAGKPYEGYVWVRGERAAELFVTLESRDGARVYAEQAVKVTAGDWRRLNFTLTPNASEKAGRFALKLKRPGVLDVGYAFLQAGEWGRFKGLPVRRDVADAMIDQGITVLRYGGSMVNNDAYRWKNMIGPRDRRPPYWGLWYRYSSNGWGIPDFMAFSEAAGFEYVPDFNMDETPQDMADFIEYAKGSAETQWGARRRADGHPLPYQLRYLELGNEERVDDAYFAKFKSLAEAIWGKDSGIVLVVGDFNYKGRFQDPFHFTGVAASRITSLAAHQRILQLAKQHNREVWFDTHIDSDAPLPLVASLAGTLSFADALDKISDGARHKIAVFELNAGNHAQRRALANALAIHAIERDGRFPVVTSANGLQPDGQNDNGWDQGLLFLNPSSVWLQPPGYVARMISRNYLPQLVELQIAGAAGKLDATAKRSVDSKMLLLQVVNPGADAVTTEIRLTGFTPHRPQAAVTELSGPLDAVNTAQTPQTIVPKQSQWSHALQDGRASYTFHPHSFTVIHFE